MKKKISKLALLLLVASLNAETKFGPGILESDARAIIAQNDDGTDSVNAAGIGINTLYKQVISEKYSVGAGFSAAMPIIESDDGAGAMLLGLERGAGASGKSGNFISLNQLHVNYEKDGNKATVGRFVADTPLAGSDDNYRLNKNAFEGVFATFDNRVKNTVLAAGYFHAFSGIDNSAVDVTGASVKGDFVSMSDAVFSSSDINGTIDKDSVSDRGVFTVAALFDDESKNLKAQAWLYMMQSVDIGGSAGALNAIYADVEYDKIALANGMKIPLAAQYISLAFTEDLNFASHNIIGVKADFLNLPMPELTAQFAMNIVSGDGAVANAWGAYPEYAASSEVFLTDLAKGSAMKLNVNYDLQKHLENSMFHFNYITQSGDNTSAGVDTSMTSIELSVEHKIPEKNLTASAYIISHGGDAEGSAALVKATYNF